jgi:two-component system OmpR family sensor kinase
MSSLRTRMLVGLMGLLLLGLAVFSAGIDAGLRRYLVQRVDQELGATQGAVLDVLTIDSSLSARQQNGAEQGSRGQGAAQRPTAQTFLTGGMVAEVRDAAGRVLASYVSPKGPLLRFPAAATPGPPRTIGSGFGSYRLLVSAISVNDQPATLLLALPLQQVNAVVARLLIFEIALGLLVLVGGAVLALWLARVTTRPLERIAVTADAIAAGDLTRRVPDEDPRSEVGRVGLAFNAMLGEIQATVARLVESELRLRRFLADASHELSTPLTSIRGYAELFRHGARDRPADLALAMERIEREAGRMGGLVDDLLLLAALDEGRPLRREPVDLAAIAADLVDDARVLAPDRPVEQDLEGAGPVWVLGDEDRLRQAAANLTANARRHTPAGTPIRVRTRADGDAGVLEVADEGPGLEPEQAARVFDRFWRADPSRSRANGGNGLGLAIVAAIAAAHGGRAVVRSTPGAGATFQIELPLASASELDPETPRL